MWILSSPAFLITYAVIQTFVAILLVRFLDLYQHEPLSSLSLMALWGAVGATAISSIGNAFVQGLLSPEVAEVFGKALSAPAVEECAKGAALLAAFAAAAFLHNRIGTARITGVTDGIVYGAAIGLGFAFTEDVAYLLEATARVGMNPAVAQFMARRDFFGITMLQHGIYTAIFGAGLGLATISRRRLARWGYPLLALALAVGLHALNNGFPELVVVLKYGLAPVALALKDPLAPDAAAIEATYLAAGRVTVFLNYLMFAGFFAGVAYWLRRQRAVIREELGPEVASGLIDVRDADLVPRYVRRLEWYWRLIQIGEIERARVERRLHIELARLSFTKRWQRDIDETAKSRQRVATLKAERAVDVYVGR